MNIQPLSKSGSPNHRFTYNGKEEQNEFNLDWHDYGARMYDSQLGRFHKIDRFAEKYADATPYHYTLNNPIKYIDVNGDSLAIILYRSAKFLNTVETGHNAILILNKKGSWTYISKNGGTSSSNASGESDRTIETFESLEEFAQSNLWESYDTDKELIAGEHYEGFLIKTDPNTNEKAIDDAITEAEADYVPFECDCTHTMEAGLKGLKDRDGEGFNYKLPKSTSSYITPGGYPVSKQYDALLPETKFNSIKEQNNGVDVDFKDLSKLENTVDKRLIYKEQ